MRKVTIKDEKLKKILQAKDKAIGEGRKLSEEITKLQEKQAKIGYKVERLKNKAIPLVEAQKIETSEFEYIANVLIEEGEVIAHIPDQVEEYKQLIREKKNEDKSNNSDNKKQG
jgi:hypothetical protein